MFKVSFALNKINLTAVVIYPTHPRNNTVRYDNINMLINIFFFSIIDELDTSLRTILGVYFLVATLTVCAVAIRLNTVICFVLRYITPKRELLIKQKQRMCNFEINSF